MVEVPQTGEGNAKNKGPGVIVTPTKRTPAKHQSQSMRPA